MSLPKIPTIHGWTKRQGRWYRRIQGIIHRVRSKSDSDLHENVVVDQLVLGEWKTIHTKQASQPYKNTVDDVMHVVAFAEFLGDLE